MTSGMDAPLFNRNLSWLSFNERVLDEAADPSVPALERLRFAAIVSSNLNEFFMVRVAEAARRARRAPGRRSPDGLSAAQALILIREEVLRQKARQAAVLEDILAALRRAGVAVHCRFGTPDPLIDAAIRARLGRIGFMLRKAGEPVPELKSDRLYVFVRFPGGYAVVPLEKREQRLLRLDAPPGRAAFALTERWLCSKVHELFPDRDVIEAFPFKVIREHRLRYSLEDSEYLEDYIEQKAAAGQRARVIRLEVDARSYSEGAMFLASSLRLDSASLYRFDMPLDLRSLFKVYHLEGFDSLRYPPVRPAVPAILSAAGSVMRTMERHDVMLHHPYDSFGTVVDFLREAAADPLVTELYHVVYRAGQVSPVMEALKEAAARGKRVTVYVELKARFDEITNLRWLRELRAAKVRVIPPFSRYKVHSKVTLAVRGAGAGRRFYAHLGTGNYHAGTARQYTDLGVLTCERRIGLEVRAYFDALAARRRLPRPRLLMAAPVNLHSGFMRLIRAETELHRRQGGGSIKAKMNSLVDPGIIRALYAASRAGVKIELLVRGICCLKPGIEGLSGNIKVISVVDRFLEHSRIYYFRAGGTEKLYLSSADWMPRNFYERFELAFPVLDPRLRRYVKETILEKGLADNVKARRLMPDGKYERVAPAEGEKRVRSQFLFAALAQRAYRGTPLEHRPAGPKNN
ncbi:MAG: polyphosphate kinase [Elusimicrobia bacterium]|nr:MAG: polyphosphate kinase [Elusimicrobiota bacterium]KAF0156118.1 MAG: polyphosphate kinase [Elusimicrobiota bacterium]